LIELEDRLKIETINEVKKNNYNNILLHDETEEKMLDSYWKCVKDPNNDILTTNDLFENLKKQNKNINYFRAPLSPNQQINLFDIDDIYDILIKSHEDTHFVYFCQFGMNRSTYLKLLIFRTAMLITYLYKNKDNFESKYLMSKSNEKGSDIDFNVISTITRYYLCFYKFKGNFLILIFKVILFIKKQKRLLPNGNERLKEVNEGIEICTNGIEFLDIRNEIILNLNLSENSRNHDLKIEYLKKFSHYLTKVDFPILK
jgi:hypothetical protein